jgi:hypothetical protein
VTTTRTRQAVIVGLLAMVPWLVMVEGWRYRNYVLTGRAEVAQISSVNLLWYRGAGIVAVRDGIPFDEARSRIERSLPDTDGWSAGAVSALYEREGLRLIASHPMLFLQTELFGLAKIVFGPGRADLLHYFTGLPYEETPEGAVSLSPSLLRQAFALGPGQALVILCMTVYLAVLYFLVALGFPDTLRDRRNWSAHAFLWWVIVYHVVVAAGPEAYARFRAPVMPFLALYAAVGVTALRRLKVRQGSGIR